MPEFKISGAEDFAARIPELLDIYRRAFLEIYESDPAHAARERRTLMRQHQYRPDFRLVVAEEPTGVPVGFCYTYRSAEGQWWHDVVSRSLRSEDRARWLADCREVVELHVLPEWQGTGVGRNLLATALDDVPERNAALSALDLPGSRALRLYTGQGFEPLLSAFRFPGSSTRYVILAKRLSPQKDSRSFPS
jgi:GNAT superfamily N-acetyltransferase